ncbi:MAG: efflux RND transporter permease subunit, partial [Gemmataceae bacterium]
MISFFIHRPIFAAVLSIILVLGGAVGGFVLPIAQYPNIAPPTVEVTAVYPGAHAKTVADTVAAPIEQQVNGVEQMLYMTSRSTNDGTYQLTVTFQPETDLNIAQVLVQNRVNLATPVLPEIVRRRGVSVKKKSPTVLMMVNLFSPDGSRNNLELSNYATIQLRDELARLPGVGDISYLGQRDYSMRLWLNPELMAARSLSATDIVRAVEQQNIQVAAGQVGQPPIAPGQVFQYTINTLGRLSNEEQFLDIIVKADTDGRIVRVRDVGRVELGAIGYDQVCVFDGKPSVALSIYQLPGSNAIETSQRIRDTMKRLREKFPSGIEYAIAYDTTPFIRESIREVFITLFDAVLLVSGVILVFLRSWRATLIPLAAVPVAIIGTFAVMWALGYSLNNLTLFGLVLAVGIVVDDAIVVVEAVEHHMSRGLDSVAATELAMQQVAGPVIAVGLVLGAVFVPCLFLTGIVGEFFRQFAVTVSVSTMISACNSLTLSPALCALLLRRDAQKRSWRGGFLFAIVGGALGAYALSSLAENLREAVQLQLFAGSATARLIGGVSGVILGLLLYALFDWVFRHIQQGYVALLRWLLRLSLLMLVVYFACLGATVQTLRVAPQGFIPVQDKGYLLLNVMLPDSSSLHRTEQTLQAIDQNLRDAPGVKHRIAIGGQSLVLGANAANFGTVYIMLEDFENRTTPELSLAAISNEIRHRLTRITTAKIDLFGTPPIDGLGAAGGFTLVIEDRGDLNPEYLQNAAELLVSNLENSAMVGDAFTGYRADTPWLTLQIDRVAARTMNVNIAELLSTLQIYFGSLYVNDFNKFGRTWQVNIQADARFRQKLDNVRRLKVRNDQGEMVPLGALVAVKEENGPVLIQRYNLYRAATVNITPRPGVSSGEVLDDVDRIVQNKLPPGLNTEWTELGFLQRQSEDTAGRALILAILLAFLVLAAQYESWALPFAVILVVPMCLLSAGVGVLIADQDINIFTQVGFVVLVGLACKNA